MKSRLSFAAWGILVLLRRLTAGAPLVVALLMTTGRAQPFLVPSTNPPAPPPALVTNLLQLRQLSRAQVAQEPPVRLRAVVTVFDPQWRALFVGDGAGATYIGITDRDARYVPGQVLEIEGRALPGLTPQIRLERSRVVAEAALPEPQFVPLDGLVSPRYDCMRVTTPVTIHSMHLEYGRLFLELSGTRGRFQAHLPAFPSPSLPTNLLFARVEITGVAGASFNRQGQLVGIRIYLNSLSDIRVRETPPADGFAQPAVTMNSISLASPTAGDRLKLRGVVTAVSPGGRLFVQDTTGAIRVRLLPRQFRGDPNGQYIPAPDPAELRPGDDIEVLGFPSLGEFAPNLSDSVFRKLGTAALPDAPEVTAEQALTGDHEAHMVRVRAQLLAHSPRPVDGSAGGILTLQQGATLFEAVVPDDPGIRRLRVGSELRVMGACEVQADDMGNPRTFRLLAPSAQAVELVAAPPRFGAVHVAGAAAATAVLVSAWVWLLRRRVQRQTRTIREGQTRLLQSEERFRTVFRASPALMTLTRYSDGRFVATNEAFLRTVGYREDEVIGRPAQELDLYAVPEERNEFRRLLKEQGRVRDREHQVLCRDRSVITVLLSGEMIDIDGEPHALIVGLDITTRKQAEQDTLRALAAERELGELKSRFVSLVSHEFRTPLGITMSAVELLRNYHERLPAPKRLELLQDIYGSTLRMSSLMEQVLLLGRVEAGKVAFKPSPIDLGVLGTKLVDETLSATNRRCPVEVEVKGGIEGAEADEALLRHILSNLLSNGVKYSPDGSPVVLRMHRDRECAVLSVVDRGIGIPEADLPRLFEAFQRAGNVGQISGTGLGLMIVKRCVEVHRGTIAVESRLGEGTTFTVRLPVFQVRGGPSG